MSAADPDAAECATQSVFDTADNTPGVAGTHSHRNTNRDTDPNGHRDPDNHADTDNNRHANPNGHNHRDANSNSNGNADYRTRHPGRPWGEGRHREPVPERHPHLG